MKVQLQERAKNKNTKTFSMSRYALVGGAIGLYFGLFFRPLREPSFAYALLLAVVVAVVMTAVHGWRERPSFRNLLVYLGLTFVKVAVVLSLLEGRHLAMDWGGKTAVVIFTVLTGVATGVWFAYEDSRRKAKQAGSVRSKPRK